jgi:hypothetical protein
MQVARTEYTANAVAPAVHRQFASSCAIPIESAATPMADFDKLIEQGDSNPEI